MKELGGSNKLYILKFHQDLCILVIKISDELLLDFNADIGHGHLRPTIKIENNI